MVKECNCANCQKKADEAREWNQKVARKGLELIGSFFGIPTAEEKRQQEAERARAAEARQQAEQQRAAQAQREAEARAVAEKRQQEAHRRKAEVERAEREERERGHEAWLDEEVTCNNCRGQGRVDDSYDAGGFSAHREVDCPWCQGLGRCLRRNDRR